MPGPLYTILLGYKEAPVREARDRFGPMVLALFGAFLHDHGPCVCAAAGGPIDVVLPVPSSRRPTGSPLRTLRGLATAARAPFSGAQWVPDLLRRGPGPVGHMHPDGAAFSVPEPRRALVRGRRVLLLDDTYVSGARAQSAAAALRRAGAAAAVIVAAGRVLRPDRVPLHAAFLRAIGPCAAGGLESTGAAEGSRCWRCAQTGAGTE